MHSLLRMQNIELFPILLFIISLTVGKQSLAKGRTLVVDERVGRGAIPAVPAVPRARAVVGRHGDVYEGELRAATVCSLAAAQLPARTLVSVKVDATRVHCRLVNWVGPGDCPAHFSFRYLCICVQITHNKLRTVMLNHASIGQLCVCLFSNVGASYLLVRKSL
jgi:hypothetical protein